MIKSAKMDGDISNYAQLFHYCQLCIFYFLQGDDKLNRCEVTPNISVVFLSYIDVLVPHSYNDKQQLDHKHEYRRHYLCFKYIHVKSMISKRYHLCFEYINENFLND